MNDALGMRIRARRQWIGIKQRQLAAAVGVTQQTIHKYELGRSVPNALHLKDLAAALQTSVEALLGDEP